MLQSIRNRAQGIVAWVIIGLIILTFALWGIQEYFNGGAETGVASVNDAEISALEYRQVYQQQRERMQEMLREGFDENVYGPQLKNDTVQGLIEAELLYQTAVNQGQRVSDAELAAMIQSFEAFQAEGKFDKAQYERLLRQQGDGPVAFEARLRRNMLANQLYSGVAATAIATDWEVNNALRLKHQRRDIGYLVVPVAKFREAVAVTDDEVKKYYEQNKEQFLASERVSIEYLELSAEQMADTVAPDDEVLRALYEEQRDSYAVPEERRASHILVAISESADAAAAEKARKAAEDLVQQIKSGADFAQLARENSDDSGSAEVGGDLGFFRRGVMEKAFDDAVFSMKPGEVKGPVRTAFGFHIIRLEEVRAERGRSFEEVREELVRQYQKGKAERQFYTQKEQLANLTYEHPDSLAPAAEQLGLKIQETGAFGREGGAGLAADPKLVEAAFSEEVLKQGLNSEVFDLSETRSVVLRVKQHEPAKTQPFEEVADTIRARLQDEAAKRQAEKLGQELLQALKAGKAPEGLVAEHGLEWRVAGMIEREGGATDRQVVAAAFRLPRPAENQGAYDGLKLSGGDYAVVRVGAVQDGDPAAVQEQERKSLRGTLTAIEGNSLYDQFVENLKRGAKIVIRKENL